MTRVFPSYFGTPGYENDAFRGWPLPKFFEDNLGIEWTPVAAANEIWLFDFSWSGLRHALKFPRSQRKLFVFEPQAVNPIQHSKRIQSLFGQVFVFSRAQMKVTNTFIEGEGYRGIGENESLPGEVRKIGAAFGNKQSVVRGSLYWLRVDAMVELLRQGFEVTLAGPGWENSPSKLARQVVRTLIDCCLSMKLPDLSLLRPLPLKRLRKFSNFHHRGWVDDEVSFFREFDALLIIENDMSFLSEKPFGGLASGTPFVYVGPSEFGAYCPYSPSEASTLSGAAVARAVAARDMVIPASIEGLENLHRRSDSAFYKRLTNAIVVSSSSAAIPCRKLDIRG